MPGSCPFKGATFLGEPHFWGSYPFGGATLLGELPFWGSHLLGGAALLGEPPSWRSYLSGGATLLEEPPSWGSYLPKGVTFLGELSFWGSHPSRGVACYHLGGGCLLPSQEICLLPFWESEFLLVLSRCYLLAVPGEVRRYRSKRLGVVKFFNYSCV